jgi:phenylpyruvate tautomerase
MPLVSITSSAPAPARETQSELLRSLSKLLSAEFHKPEQWVMTCFSPRAEMTFGGSDAPACYIEVKNVGKMTPEQTERLSAAIMQATSKALGVSAERTYIEFADAVGHLWGWNGETFG